MLNSKKLEKYLDSGFNVLLEGSHGIGKTAIIKEVFESKGLNWKYFSASTMDPWIDFIGVPKTVKDSNGHEFLELIKPRDFANDEVEAIFFDEFNRAPTKVMNAVMELIQFRSINGTKFKNLKVVWAAINPFDEDGTYAVEQLDPAIKDRFHIQIKIPLELDVSYLLRTYGENAKPFIKWWNELPKELKFKISPRRLDYAIQVYNAKGDLRDTLPAESNVKKLEAYINEMNKGLELADLLNKSDKELKDFFTLENSIKYGEQILTHKKCSHLLKYLNKDFIESNIQKNDGSKFNTLLIQEAIKEENFLNTLSRKSKEIVEESKKNGGVLSSVRVDYAIEQLIRQTVEKSLNNSVALFVKKLEPVFSTFCLSLKDKKSTDIVSFFELVFESKDSNGLAMKENIFKLLGTYKTMNSYKPSTPYHKTLLGFLLNFAIKYATDSKSMYLSKLELVMLTLYSVAIKTKNSSDSTHLILVSFEEKNWSILKEILQKNKTFDGADRTIKIRDCIKEMKSRTDSKMVYKSPTKIENAKDIFSKKEFVLTTNLETINLKNLLKESVYE